MDQWYDIFKFFWWDNPVGIIASCTIIVLAVYLAFYITIELIELAYWISVQSIKASWVGMTIIFYSLIFLYIIIPIDAISPNRRLADSFHIYAKNLEKVFFNFYPKLEKAIEKRNAKKKKEHPSVLPYESAAISPKTRRIAQEQVKQDELTAQTVIISHPPKPVTNGYHCSKCGKPFTRMMNILLSKKKETFCESCGQLFYEQNSIPIPVSK